MDHSMGGLDLFSLQKGSAMKRIWMMCCVISMCATAAWAAEPDRSKLVPSVTVTGSGEASARPDMATVQVGVVTDAESASEALKKNSEAMSGLMQSLAGQGIAEKDIQTTNVSVSPRYSSLRNGESMHIVGYEATNNVQAKIRKLSNLGTILDDVVEKGANRMHGVSFSVAEPNPILDQARQKSIQDAHRKADLYAAAAGVKLGRVLLIEEQSHHLPRMEPLVMARGAMAAAAVPIASGEQEFRVSISVTYALEP
jgi:uncharacterized protein YggE